MDLLQRKNAWSKISIDYCCAKAKAHLNAIQNQLHSAVMVIEIGVV